MPEIVFKLLGITLWIGCAVLLEPESTPLHPCFGQVVDVGLLLCTRYDCEHVDLRYAFFFLKNQWMMERLSLVKKAALVSQVQVKSIEISFPMKTKSAVTAQNLQTINTFLTLEKSVQQEWQHLSLNLASCCSQWLLLTTSKKHQVFVLASVCPTCLSCGRRSSPGCQICTFDVMEYLPIFSHSNTVTHFQFLHCSLLAIFACT